MKRSVGQTKLNKKQYRVYLTLSWVIGIIAVVSAIATENMLPPELKQYLESQAVTTFTAKDTVSLLASLVLVVAILVSYIGLYFWKKWSRPLLICTIVFSFFLTWFDNIHAVYSVWTESIFTIAYILMGVVIAAIFFCTEIKEEFEKV